MRAKYRLYINTKLDHIRVLHQWFSNLNIDDYERLYDLDNEFFKYASHPSHNDITIYSYDKTKSKRLIAHFGIIPTVILGFELSKERGLQGYTPAIIKKGFGRWLGNVKDDCALALDDFCIAIYEDKKLRLNEPSWSSSDVEQYFSTIDTIEMTTIGYI